jgi:hypothetical protein
LTERERDNSIQLSLSLSLSLSPGRRSDLVRGGFVVVGRLHTGRGGHLQVVVLVVISHQLHPVLSLERERERERTRERERERGRERERERERTRERGRERYLDINVCIRVISDVCFPCQ